MLLLLSLVSTSFISWRYQLTTTEIEIIEHLWIRMSDGVRLSAKVWLPVGARSKPVPSILEFIPYRKRDSYALRDHANHAWFAARGYACIRPDMRGHGDSEGVMLDEYSLREQEDALEVIEWLADQDWCTGKVGMMGLSWGGIASLQAATKQPPALKAVIAVGSSVDRYYDDAGYLVGGYPGQGLGWGGVMCGYCIRPPDPDVVGIKWREMWLERLEKTPLFIEKWLSHQLRDETWIQGSVCENFDQIKTPILGVSGWNDCWPNTMIRLIENIKSPITAISGPWGHVYPNLGGPGPKIGFLKLALDWWDTWLKEDENDSMRENKFLAYIQTSHEPDQQARDRPGFWIKENKWPSDNSILKRYYLTKSCLVDCPNELVENIEICSPLTLGVSTGEYMPISGILELPADQSEDDSYSITFDTDKILKPISLLGTSKVYLKVSSNCTHGIVAARLCDVSPDGKSTLISYGILNLKLREGREKLSKITPDEFMDVCIRLNDTGWQLSLGRQLRLSLSSQLWPMAWPQPEEARLNICLSSCYLEIPTLQPSEMFSTNQLFTNPEASVPLPHQVLEESSGTRKISKDQETGELVYDVVSNGGEIKFTDINLIYSSNNSQHYMVKEGDPLSVKMIYIADFSFARGDWLVQTKSKLMVTCDEDFFFLKANISGIENNQIIYSRDWDVKVPRLVY